MAARRIGALARHVGSGDAAAAVETEVKRTVGPEEQALLAAAEELFPGGTPNGNSTAKGFLFAEGQGAYVFDKTGTKYLDLAMGSGPMFIGHAHPVAKTKIFHFLAKLARITDHRTAYSAAQAASFWSKSAHANTPRG